MVKVVVNPILDFDKQVSQSKEITSPSGAEPGTGVLDSSEVIKESVKNSGANGVPGTDTNPGNNPPTYQTGTDENGNYDNSHSIYKYRYNETKTDSEKAVGNIVPEKTTATITLMYGNRIKNAGKLTKTYLNTFKSAAGTAIGVPAQNISVVTLKLAPQEVVKTPLNQTIKDIINNYGFFAIMLILIVALMISAIPRKKFADETGSELELAEEEAAMVGPKFIVPDNDEPVPEIDMEERSEVKKQIDKFVTQKPDAVAQLLRNWLSDDWD
jgi:flagellar M-ring protein FliF